MLSLRNWSTEKSRRFNQQALAYAIAARDRVGDAALRILDASGKLIPGGPRLPKGIEAQYDGVSFLYMTPFQKRPQPPQLKYYMHALVKQKWSKPDLPYELDIWDSKKVLNITPETCSSSAFGLVVGKSACWLTTT